MRSIRMHLTAWVIGGVLLLSMLAATFCFVRTRTILAREFDANLLSRAHALCAMVQRDPNGTLEVMSADVLVPKAQHLEQSAEFFELWDSAGVPLRRSSSLKGTDVSAPTASEVVTFWNLTMPNGQPGRAVIFKYEPAVEDEPGGPPEAGAMTRPEHDRVTLALAQDLLPVRRVEKVLLASIGIAALLMCIGMLIVVPLVVSRGLSPLRSVSDQAAAIDATRLSGRFDTESMPRELLPICTRLNDLLARLESSFMRERRFSADVAHELRTPIAELRTLAEVMTRWPPDASASGVAFRDALGIARQMEGVVTTLLALARCEAGKLQLQADEIDICDCVRGASKPLHEAAADRGLSVAIDIPDAALIVGDRAIVDAMIANILSNAGAHCVAGGDVTCAVCRDASHVELRVSNTSSGLTAEDLKHVTEAFWRKDAARSGTAHAGLGLALVQAYAQAMDAEFKITLEERTHFCVLLRWPAAKKDAADAVPPSRRVLAPSAGG